MKFAFIAPGSGSHPSNAAIVRALAEYFPELQLDAICVSDLIRSRKLLLLANAFWVFIEYGRDIVTRRRKLRDCFYRTTYLFRRTKTLVSERLSEGEYLFSFQHRSLFDGSKDGLPNYVYTDHTHLANLSYPAFDRRDLFSSRWIELEANIYRNARLNFTRSSNVSRSIVEDYGCSPNRVVCVYAGTNVGAHFEIDEAKYCSKNVLFVGIDWERKGGPELVEAFRRVLEVHPDARLTIVGCSPKVDVPNCDVVGKVSLQSLNDYYEKASVFCLPTRLEPFGVVFLEAFAHALPVVATDIGAIPDFVWDGQTGYLVGTGDIEHLAEVLIRLLQNPEHCRTLGEKGRSLVLERYTWEKVGAEIAKNIRNTLGNSSTRAGS